MMLDVDLERFSPKSLYQMGPRDLLSTMVLSWRRVVDIFLLVPLVLNDRHLPYSAR